MSVSKQPTHDEYADGLIQIAEWWRAHPEIPLSFNADEMRCFSVKDKEQLAVLLVALGDDARRHEGPDVPGALVAVGKSFGVMKLRFYVNRDLAAQRVQMETRMVEQIIYKWEYPGLPPLEDAEQEGS